MEKQSMKLIALAAFLGFTSLPPAKQTGIASWYGTEFQGKRMSNGQPFDPTALTAASWYYPLGAEVTVTYYGGQNAYKRVKVFITDRGPAKRLVQKGRIIDLSRAAFKALEDPKVGLITVTVTLEP